MTPAITVRPLTPDADWQEFRAMRLRAIEECPEAFSEPLEAARATSESVWRSKWLGEGRVNVRAFGGYVDGVLSGIVVVIPYWEDPSQKTGYVVSLYVTPDARGSGLVDGLYHAVIGYARDVPEWTRLELGHYITNPRAIAVSKRHRFSLMATHRRTNSSGAEETLEDYGMDV